MPGRRRARRRSTGVILLLVTLGGCTPRQSVRLPGDQDRAARSDESFPLVKVGQNVVVHLKHGGEVSGEVTSVDEENLVLGRPSNYGYEEVMLAVADIARVETASPTAWTALAGVGIFAASVVTMMFVWLLIDPPEFN